jgi:hypothetical protein
LDLMRVFCLCSRPVYGMTETGIIFMCTSEDTLEQMTSTFGCLSHHTEENSIVFYYYGFSLIQTAPLLHTQSFQVLDLGPLLITRTFQMKVSFRRRSVTCRQTIYASVSHLVLAKSLL